MLHLLAGSELVVPSRRGRGMADAVAATEAGQRRVGQDSAAGGELLVHAPQMSLEVLM